MTDRDRAARPRFGPQQQVKFGGMQANRFFQQDVIIQRQGLHAGRDVGLVGRGNHHRVGHPAQGQKSLGRGKAALRPQPVAPGYFAQAGGARVGQISDFGPQVTQVLGIDIGPPVATAQNGDLHARQRP